MTAGDCSGGCHPVAPGAGLLATAARWSSSRRSITLDAQDVETLEESLDRLRLEVEALRASRERLVLGADAVRRRIERDIHDGPQQHLVALAVNLQLARRLADADLTAAKVLLEEMGRDVRHALDGMGKLAHRIYPPLLEQGGLVAALRAAAAGAGVPTRVDVEVAAGADYPPEVAGAVYFCCLEVLERSGDGARATITVRSAEGALAFEVAQDGSASGEIDAGGLLGLRDRVEALGGELTVRAEPGRGTQVSGSLPLPSGRSRPGRGSRR